MVVASLLSGVWSGFEAAIVSALNTLIASFGTLGQSTFDLLPEMPDLPTMPGDLAVASQWVAWVFPVATIEDILAWATLMWTLWLVLSIVFRWAKIDRGNA